MSYQFYKVMHFVGIFLMLVSLGGMALHVMNGGTREFPNRKWTGMLHGIGTVVALVGGFGLMARLGINNGWPGWIHGKLAIWLVLAGLPALVYRAKALAKAWLILVPTVAAIAVYLAVTKPGQAASTHDQPTASASHEPNAHLPESAAH